ncbi:MAG: hypothetical protein OEZ43_21145 [Gammaproteobacteria bacterium]|nr:hypothetical protein [Gammaproteobacteria bacterium]
MSQALSNDRVRFLATLEIVRREIKVYKYSQDRLFAMTIDRNWVEGLETDMQAAETLEAFVSRFGRLQDTMGDKLVPRALSALAEKTGSMLDNLNRAERLGWIASAETWLVARELRNKLVHEYMLDENLFAQDVNNAANFYSLFENTYKQLKEVAEKQFGVAEADFANYLKSS